MHKVTDRMIVPLGVSGALLLVLMVLLFTYSAPAAFAQLANDTVTVNVTVLGVSEITVSPSFLLFIVSPGQISNPSFLDIKNTGSLNVTQIYAYVDTLVDESVRPYSSANSTYYAAGGVLTIQNETNRSIYFTGRLEWNETEAISNIIRTGVTSPVAQGFYRNNSREYNWLVGNGTTHLGSGSAVFCNGTGTEFALDDDIDNGTASTRTPLTTGISRDGGDLDWSYFSVDRGSSPLPEACVAVYQDCGKIFVYKYDKRSGFDTCVNSNFLQEPDLVPGDVHSVNISAYMPFGIPANPGSMNVSTLTVVAT